MKRIRLQLVGILALVAMLPALPAGWAAYSLFRQLLDPILEIRIIEGARFGLDSTRELLHQEIERFERAIRAGQPADTLQDEAWSRLSPRERSTLEELERGAAQTDPEGGGLQVLLAPQRVRLDQGEILLARVSSATGPPMWVKRPISAELSERAHLLSENLRLVQTLRRERDSVVRSIWISFTLFYGGILLVILLAGLWVASRITKPVAELGDGIREVAAGRLDTRIRESGGGEISRLLAEFNQMVERLSQQRSELLRLEKVAAWRQMARGLAHEIKNPLTPIQLSAQQLRDSYRGDDADFRDLVEEATSIIEEEVNALRNLVSEFSQFARLPEPKKYWLELEGLVGDLLQLYGANQLTLSETVLEGQTASGSVPAKPNSTRIWGDREQLHRVLINLVNNALRAQEGGSTEPVRLSIDWVGPGGGRTGQHTGLIGEGVGRAGERIGHTDERVTITVADRGPGVPESERRRIFEPDYTTKSDGMGLGLAIVETIVQNHRGSIRVEDRSGGGAVFIVDLPREPQEPDGSDGTGGTGGTGGSSGTGGTARSGVQDGAESAHSPDDSLEKQADEPR